MLFVIILLYLLAGVMALDIAQSFSNKPVRKLVWVVFVWPVPYIYLVIIFWYESLSNLIKKW